MAMLVASPHSQRPYFSALAIPTAVLLGVLLKNEAGVSRRAVQLTLGACAALSTILPLVLSSRRLALAYQQLSPYFFAAVVVSLMLVRLRLTDSSRSAREFPSASRTTTLPA